MVGNKCEYREFIDGSIRAEVVKDDAMKLASELNLKYYETSGYTHSLTHSLTYLPTYLLTYLLTYSRTHLLTYLFTHLFV